MALLPQHQFQEGKKQVLKLHQKKWRKNFKVKRHERSGKCYLFILNRSSGHKGRRRVCELETVAENRSFLQLHLQAWSRSNWIHSCCTALCVVGGGGAHGRFCYSTSSGSRPASTRHSCWSCTAVTQSISSSSRHKKNHCIQKKKKTQNKSRTFRVCKDDKAMDIWTFSFFYTENQPGKH